jgi:hypothetical protein
VPAALGQRTIIQLRVSSGTTIPQGFSVQFTLAQVEVGAVMDPWQVGPGMRALAIPEAVNNLLTAMQSNLEGGITGWNIQNSAALSQNTTFVFEGLGSLRIICANLGSSGAISTNITGLPASGPFTFSAHYRGDPAQAQVANSMVLELVMNYTTGSAVSTTLIVTPDPNAWKRSAVTMVSDNTRTLSSINVRARSNLTQNGLTTYWDAFQLEQNTYATPWQSGGPVRGATVVTVPGRDTINPAEGTIEIWFRLDPLASGVRGLIDTRNPGNRFSYADALVCYIDGTIPALQYGAGNRVVTIRNGTAAVGIWHYFVARWNGAGASLWLDSALIEAVAIPPQLAVPPSVLIGGFGLSDTPLLPLNGAIAALRFSNVFRTDAELTAQNAALAPFMRDTRTLAVWNFDGTLREVLPDSTAQFVAESDFVPASSITATPAALSGYLETNLIQYAFPTQTWRSTSTALQVLTLDLGFVVPICGVWVFAPNFEWLTIQTSLDGTAGSYADLPGSPYAALLDSTDNYRKCAALGRANARFIQITVLAQPPDNGVTYLESGSVLVFSDLNALPKPFSKFEVSAPDRNLLKDESGGHIDVREAGPQFVTVTFSGIFEVKEIAQARALGLFGQGKPFLFFFNRGSAEEAYLLQFSESVRYSQSGMVYETAFTCRSRI